MAAALKRLKKAELREPYLFWAAGESAEVPAKVAELRAALAKWMTEPSRAVARTGALGAEERVVLDALLAAPHHRAELSTRRQNSWITAVVELGPTLTD